MILAKTWYETYNNELLAIVKTFKIWRHYLDDCKHKVFMLTNLNNLCHFIDIKSLSFKQVYWAKKFFRYYFWIDYYQGKTNGAGIALSCFFQKNKDEKKKLWIENTQILYYLQS